MEVRIVPSLAEPVGRIWLEAHKISLVRQNNFFVAAPLSSTPLPIYQWIISNASSFPGWENVNFVLMDEQLECKTPPFQYVSKEDKASYEGFAFQRFLGPLYGKISCHIPIIKPDLTNIDKFELRQPIDLLILALGVGGNYANVMPMTPRETGWHVSRLTPDFKAVHTEAEGSSYAGAHFREFGMSLGPQQVLAARKVVVIASGGKKRALVSELASFNKFDPAFPLSIIHDPEVSSRVTIYLTDEIGNAWPK